MDGNDDGGYVAEEIERRAELRGVIRGLSITVPGDRQVDVLEASSKGFFVAVSDPESLRLADLLDVEVAYDETRFTCRVEVVRKEIHPRRGVALRIIRLTPATEEILKQILEEM